MYQQKKRIHLLYFLIDMLLIGLSFYLPYKLNTALIPQNLLGFKAYFPVFGFWGIAIIFLLNNSQLYHTDRSLTLSQEFLKVVKCVLVSAILSALFIFFIKIDVFSRTVFVEITFLLGLTLSFWRGLKRIYVRYLIRKGYSNYNVLIVGAGKVGIALCEEIKDNSYFGLKIIGFLDDDKEGKVYNFDILGKIKDLETVAKKYFIDEIYVTIPSARKVASEIVEKGVKLGKSVRVVVEHFDLPYRQVNLNYIGLIPLIAYFEKGLHGSEQIIKRLFDFVITSVILILLSPLFLIIAYLIKREGSGPVFYISKRSGKYGKIFNFYKFRSMIDGAEMHKKDLLHKSEVKGPIFKIKKDPRITNFGKFMRKYSLDELPQLFNVLKGDMSLVGPRPFPVDESQKLENRHMPRLNIKPGITGLAQIKGRSDLPFHQWAKWDLWYYNHWSFGLDLKIIWWTIPAVLKGKGAY